MRGRKPSADVRSATGDPLSTLALALVLASSILHAAWNAGMKPHPDAEAGAVGVVAVAASCSAVLALLVGESAPPPAAWAWIGASALVEGAYFVTLTRSLARLPLGTAYGIGRGGGQLVTWPVSMGLQGERPGPVALVGAVVLAGGLLVRIRPPWDARGLAWAAGCALAIGAYPLTYKAALAGGAPPFTLFAASLFGALPVQLALLRGPRVPRLRRALGPHAVRIAACAVACAASFLLFLGALGLDGAGRASAVRNTSIVFATLFGALQGEALDRRAVVGALAITVGAIAVGGG